MARATGNLVGSNLFSGRRDFPHPYDYGPRAAPPALAHLCLTQCIGDSGRRKPAWRMGGNEWLLRKLVDLVRRSRLRISRPRKVLADIADDWPFFLGDHHLSGPSWTPQT